MGIETFEFIDDLVATNPTSTDNVSEGDDHLRGLKTTLKNTFPNVTGAINPTETELNYVDGVTSAIQTQLDAKATAAQGTTADAALPKAGGALTGAVTTTSTFDGVDIATRDGVLTTTTTTANAALPKAGGALTGAVTTTSTFDGRDVATDGTKLDGIATSANNYSHPTGAGNNHVPTGGSTGQLLTNTSSGTGTWQDAPQGVSNSKLFYYGSFS